MIPWTLNKMTELSSNYQAWLYAKTTCWDYSRCLNIVVNSAALCTNDAAAIASSDAVFTQIMSTTNLTISKPNNRSRHHNQITSHVSQQFDNAKPPPSFTFLRFWSKFPTWPKGAIFDFEHHLVTHNTSQHSQTF